MMSTMGNPDRQPDWAINFDTSEGKIQEFIDGVVRHEVHLREGLINDLTRAAVIYELERLGYTVIPPEKEE